MDTTATISKYSGAKENECACKKCKDMCRKLTCIGTPEDILRLINNGHVSKLRNTVWAAGVIYGTPEIYMVQPYYDKQKGACVFLNEDSLCTLHDHGIKPTEGKMASHEPQIHDLVTSFPLTWMVAGTWTLDRYKKTIYLIVKAVKKYNEQRV